VLKPNEKLELYREQELEAAGTGRKRKWKERKIGGRGDGIRR
jgi:hypothetical protein